MTAATDDTYGRPVADEAARRALWAASGQPFFSTEWEREEHERRKAPAERAAAYRVMHGAVLAVIAATQAYLPPDGITSEELINRVLLATDNATIVPALKVLA